MYKKNYSIDWYFFVISSVSFSFSLYNWFDNIESFIFIDNF